MRKLRDLALTVVVCLLSFPVSAARFDFVAFGDTAYNLPADIPVLDGLIGRINATKPAFVVHVGDIWGANPCTEAEYQRVLKQFSQVRAPLVYTPGDNEWVDCRSPELLAAYRAYLEKRATPEQMMLLGRVSSLDGEIASVGRDDALARLADIRRLFFSDSRSLGGKPMTLIRQADVSAYRTMVENARWQRAGVHFVTVHVVGSQNNAYLNNPARLAESSERTQADIDWLNTAFAEATAADARAVVVIMHASLFQDGPGDRNFGKRLRGDADGPYYWIARAVRDLGSAFGKPVLMIHGDFHEFIVDRPFAVDDGEAAPRQYDNILRLQVHGAPDIRAVRVSVDPETPGVFGFTPLQ
ncbi:MAG: hypothetical protein H6994_10240 [Pseudomonadales bacterium]|nr:hypothetical protein [Pseudomonadales bacterium]